MHYLTKDRMWDFMDDCGIKFRKPMQELVDTYGSQPSSWHETLYYCAPSNKNPILDNLARPFVFQFSPIETKYHSPQNLAAPANYFHSYISNSPISYNNFDNAVHQLEKLFGTGEDNSAINTKSRIWKFKDAKIEAFVFPNDKRSHLAPNSGHDDPRCKIVLHPEYFFPASEDELKILDAYSPIYKGPVCNFSNATLIRELPISETIDLSGIGMDDLALHLIKMHPNKRCEIVPISWIDEINYCRQLPAKGSGGTFLDIFYKPPERQHYRASSLHLLRRKPYLIDELRDVSVKLSKLLNKPLREDEQEDM